MRFIFYGRHPLLRGTLRVDRGRPGELVLDARSLGFASPLELSAIVALAARARHDEKKVQLLLPDDLEVAGYLQRMNVLQRIPRSVVVKGKVPADERVDKSEVLLELACIREAYEADEVAEGIVPLARRHASSEATTAMWSGLGELLDNACSHASSPVGVFACAQAYTGATSGRRGLELAIADSGIGILKHLRGNPRFRRFRSSATAIKYALRPGVTGTRDRRGYGFSDVLDSIGEAGLGRLVVRSGDGLARIEIRHNRKSSGFETCAVPIQGTWVWMRVRIP